MKTNQTEHEKLCRAMLAKQLKPGDTVYTILRHVSRSGMMRRISAITIKAGRKEISIRQFDHALEILCGFKMGDHDGNMIGGCGRDMGFELVYQLSTALWPDGFTCPGESCQSNDHTNGDKRRDPHRHANGGYALRQKWL